MVTIMLQVSYIREAIHNELCTPELYPAEHIKVDNAQLRNDEGINPKSF